MTKPEGDSLGSPPPKHHPPCLEGHVASVRAMVPRKTIGTSFPWRFNKGTTTVPSSRTPVVNVCCSLEVSTKTPFKGSWYHQHPSGTNVVFFLVGVHWKLISKRVNQQTTANGKLDSLVPVVHRTPSPA